MWAEEQGTGGVVQQGEQRVQMDQEGRVHEVPMRRFPGAEDGDRRAERGEQNPFTQVIHLNRAPQEGGGQVFASRRQRELVRGRLGALGATQEYVGFYPAKLFSRFIGVAVLEMNQVFEELKERDCDDMVSGLYDQLREHHGNLRAKVQETRGKMVKVVQFCDAGFGGGKEELLEKGILYDEESGVRNRYHTSKEEKVVSREAVPDPFEKLRVELFENDILTEDGRDEGLVAFRPCTFYGRFLADVICGFNDALRRVESNTSQQITSGDWRLPEFYLRLEDVLREIGEDFRSVCELGRAEV